MLPMFTSLKKSKHKFDYVIINLNYNRRYLSKRNAHTVFTQLNAMFMQIIIPRQIFDE